MELTNYKGKRFRYDSPITGISDWVATATWVGCNCHVSKTKVTPDPNIKGIDRYEVIGFKHLIHVHTDKHNVYDFDRCIWLD